MRFDEYRFLIITHLLQAHEVVFHAFSETMVASKSQKGIFADGDESIVRQLESRSAQFILWRSVMEDDIQARKYSNGTTKAQIPFDVYHKPIDL